ncbi:protein kinase [Actinoplanes sp. NPDC051861]|uniref:protein kinase domain-containing protein n=1 Tax=Actinoplanes sp. NPDC051861 TaxID=3155170 RepID=UPI00341837E8
MGDGDRIGRYQLWEEIGRGPSTVVRRATAPGAPPIAAKLLRPDLARSPRVRDLLTRIGGTLHHLPHPGIARMHDLVVESDRLALIVDFVDGPSLRDYLAGEGGTLPLGDSAVVVAQVADALAAVHARGLMHLDLKPENVLLVGGAYPLRVKVSDFGMAALPDVFCAGVYAAPELSAGGPPTVAADVFSLGVLLAEMTADSESGQVRDLVRDCLAVHPWERPSAAEFADRVRVLVPAEEALAGTGWVRSGFMRSGLVRTGLARTGLVGTGLARTGLVGTGLAGTGLVRAGTARRRSGWAAGLAGAMAVAVTVGVLARLDYGGPQDQQAAEPPSVTAGFGPRPSLNPESGRSVERSVERENLAGAAPSRGTYAAHLAGGNGTLSLAVRDGRAVGYLCDGAQMEAWLKGTVTGAQVSLSGRDGAAITGTLERRTVTGTVTHGTRAVEFALPLVSAPSGLYRAAARLRDAEVKGGWIVLPDGSQVGVLTTDGVPGPAPSLDTGARSAVLGADTVPAVPVDTATGTGF